MDLIYEIRAAVKRAASKLILPDIDGVDENGNTVKIKQGLRAVDAPNACKFEDINFQAGTLTEITQTLDEYGRSDTLRYQKFPVVCLVTPYAKTKPASAELENVRFTLFIACAANATDKRATRQVKSFSPILHPVAREVIRQIIDAPFCMTYEGDIRYQEIEHDYWAKEKQAQIFNQAVDAIELRDFTINIQQPYCI